jgi:hypothetical protein
MESNTIASGVREPLRVADPRSEASARMHLTTTRHANGTNADGESSLRVPHRIPIRDHP